ncbi:MAG: hypothetical protein GX957_00040 [Clostridiaceae bacterium]|nr:hypothetical protein [Clostridiaceae bacterium]
MKKAKGRLIFNLIPEGYHNNQKVIFIGIDFSGIQSFIFQQDVLEDIYEITRRSEYITRLAFKIDEDLKVLLNEYVYYSITNSGGKLQAVIKYSKKAANLLENYLSDLQRIIFTVNEGKFQLFYGLVITRVVKQANNSVKESAYSDLMKAIGKNKLQCSNVYGFDISKYNDGTYSLEYLTKNIENQPKLALKNKLAALKFDFDNLGNFFAAVKAVDTIAHISKNLSITIDKIVYSLKDVKLIYSGGDDIFLLCPQINLSQVAFDFYEGILDSVETNEVLKNYRESFGLSCGIFTFNKDVSLIVYAVNSEKQLSLSKIRGKNRVTIEDISFTWDELKYANSIIEKFFTGSTQEAKKELSNYSFVNLLRYICASTKNQEERMTLRKLLAKADYSE